MKPTKEATYLNDLRRERNHYKKKWKDSVREVNKEIVRLEKLMSRHANLVSSASLLQASYQLSFLKDLKISLGGRYDKNKDEKEYL